MKQPVALVHKDIKDHVHVVPSETVAGVLRLSGWKDAPKSEQPPVIPNA